jgi:mannose-6-phosphate isomerase-like protein (cupin superfamily)
MKAVAIRIRKLTDAVREHHKHVTLATLNRRYIVKAAVNDQPYPWHHHPNSDELLIVLEGRLIVETGDGRHTLGLHDAVFLPAGVEHRTTPVGRAVNLVVEDEATDTVFRDELAPEIPGPPGGEP